MRLTNCRFPQLPNALEIENAYRHTQIHMLGSGRIGEWGKVMDDWVDFYKEKIRENCSEFTTYEDALKAFTEEVHPKRELRRRAHDETYANGREYHETNIESCTIKFKSHEFAKDKKKGRMIGDLTSPGCIVAGPAIAKTKEAFITPYTTCDHNMMFIKSADVGNLSAAMNTLLFDDCNQALYHSDDSCVGVQTSEGRICWNLDIASCDVSHGPKIFELALELTEDSDMAHQCVMKGVAQCHLPAIIPNPYNRHEKIKLLHDIAVLFSGSVLTTLINNIATSLIYLRFFYLLRKRVLSREETEWLLIEAAQDMGYVVTLEACMTPEDVQFLKHSPVMTVDGYKAVLNIGVILRTLGQCVGDIPVKGYKNNLPGAAQAYSAGVVAGWEHAGNHSLLATLREKYPNGTAILGDKAINKVTEFLDDADIVRRYGLPESELRDFLKCLREAKLGDEIHSHFADVVMKKDYGY